MRKAKTLANKRIDEYYPSPRPPLASEAPHNANLTPGVTVGNIVPEMPHNPIPPPLWNAWWCQTCTSLHLVGDGGELIGECIKCQVRDPIRNHVMLDPDEIELVRMTPGLAYNPPSSESGASIPPLSGGGATTLPDIYSSSEEASAGDLVGDVLFPSGGDNDFESDDDKTDLEVSRYSFFDRLEHYMERETIKEDYQKAVELAIMVEAGSIVREMGTVTKEQRATRFFNEYINLIGDISDSRFDDDGVRRNMVQRFKGMRRGEMNAENLLRKYESEMTNLKKFAYKFPGVGDLSKLPSGTAQLQQLKRPVVMKLWVQKFPVRFILLLNFFSHITLCTLSRASSTGQAWTGL